MRRDWRKHDEREFRCTVVLDSSYDGGQGRLLGAMAHALLGLSADPFLQAHGTVVKYTDQDSSLNSIGFHYPCIVLAARSQGEMRRLLERARKANIPRSEVVEDMMMGTSAAQSELVFRRSSDEHKFLVIAMFGTPKDLSKITGSLPLY